MLQSPPGAPPSSAPAMDKSGPCGPGAPGSSAAGKAQPPRSASAGPAAGESKPKGGKRRAGTGRDGTGDLDAFGLRRGSVVREGREGPQGRACCSVLGYGYGFPSSSAPFPAQ